MRILSQVPQMSLALLVAAAASDLPRGIALGEQATSDRDGVFASFGHIKHSGSSGHLAPVKSDVTPPSNVHSVHSHAPTDLSESLVPPIGRNLAHLAAQTKQSTPDYGPVNAPSSVGTAVGGLVSEDNQSPLPVQDSVAVRADPAIGTTTHAPAASLVLPIVAVLVSLVAIYMSRRLSTAGFRAAENVNDDIAQLLASLRAIMHKAGAAIESLEASVDVQREQRQIADFTVSTTAYAMHAWVHVKAQREKSGRWRVLPLLLAYLQRTDHPLRLAMRGAQIEALFRSMKEDDIKRIRRYASKVQDGVEPFLDSANALVKALLAPSLGPLDTSIATDIDVNGKAVKAVLEDDTSDVYRFVVKEAGYYAIETSKASDGEDTVDIAVLLYADDGETCIGNTLMLQREYPSLHENLEPGTHYVSVQRLGDRIGSYQVSVSFGRD